MPCALNYSKGLDLADEGNCSACECMNKGAGVKGEGGRRSYQLLTLMKNWQEIEN